MADLSCSYLGMKLDSPLVPSASPLSRCLDSARELEDAGASALVMYSLFEEEIQHEEEMHHRFILEQSIGHAEADSFLPAHCDYTRGVDRYLENLASLKTHLDIPVIASLNGISLDAWIEHGLELQQAGADAIELNVYYMAADPDTDSATVEDRYLELLTALRSKVELPIVMKLSPQFSALSHFIQRLQAAGANGVSLFNRFYQPDLDIETLRVAPQIQLSRPADSLLSMRWIAILHGRVDLTLAATGGLHSAEDVIKLILAGADVTHLCSTLLENGSDSLTTIRRELEQWMEEHGYDSLSEVRGLLSQKHVQDPSVYERANYVWLLDSHSSSGGVRR